MKTKSFIDKIKSSIDEIKGGWDKFWRRLGKNDIVVEAEQFAYPNGVAEDLRRLERNAQYPKTPNISKKEIVKNIVKGNPENRNQGIVKEGKTENKEMPDGEKQR